MDMTLTDAFEEAEARAELVVEMDRNDVDPGESAVATATVIHDGDRALLVEVGTAPDGPFACVRAFVDGEQVAIATFATDESTMVTIAT